MFFFIFASWESKLRWPSKCFWQSTHHFASAWSSLYACSYSLSHIGFFLCSDDQQLSFPRLDTTQSCISISLKKGSADQANRSSSQLIYTRSSITKWYFSPSLHQQTRVAACVRVKICSRLYSHLWLSATRCYATFWKVSFAGIGTGQWAVLKDDELGGRIIVALHLTFIASALTSQIHFARMTLWLHIYTACSWRPVHRRKKRLDGDTDEPCN